LGAERRGWRTAAWPLSLARKYKSPRTAQGHSRAGNNIMSRQKTTIFASLGRGCRCGRQAFFDKCLSTFNRMAASSYMPPVSIKMTAFDFSKAVISGRDKLCCTTAFFLLPSCGSSLALYYNALAGAGLCLFA